MERTRQNMNVYDIEIEVERKPIKNLHLAVYPPDGRVHVSAPESYSGADPAFHPQEMELDTPETQGDHLLPDTGRT